MGEDVYHPFCSLATRTFVLPFGMQRFEKKTLSTCSREQGCDCCHRDANYAQFHQHDEFLHIISPLPHTGMNLHLYTSYQSTL